MYLGAHDHISATGLDGQGSKVAHVGRVDVSLDDVEDGNVARGLARRRRYHAVFRLEQTTHDV